jgi:hypothetical protein
VIPNFARVGVGLLSVRLGLLCLLANGDRRGRHTRGGIRVVDGAARCAALAFCRITVRTPPPSSCSPIGARRTAHDQPQPPIRAAVTHERCEYLPHNLCIIGGPIARRTGALESSAVARVASRVRGGFESSEERKTRETDPRAYIMRTRGSGVGPTVELNYALAGRNPPTDRVRAHSRTHGSRRLTSTVSITPLPCLATARSKGVCIVRRQPRETVSRQELTDDKAY